MLLITAFIESVAADAKSAYARCGLRWETTSINSMRSIFELIALSSIRGNEWKTFFADWYLRPKNQACIITTRLDNGVIFFLANPIVELKIGKVISYA